MADEFRWDQDKIRALEEIAASSKSVREVAEKFRARFGVQITTGAIENSFRRYREFGISSLFAGPAPKRVPLPPETSPDIPSEPEEPTQVFDRAEVSARIEEARAASSPTAPPSESEESQFERLFQLTSKKPITLEEVCDRLEKHPGKVRELADKARAAGFRVEFSDEGKLGDLDHYRMRETMSDLKAAHARLVEQLSVKDAQIDALEHLKTAPPVRFVAPEGRGEGKQRLGVPVMLLSDWHVEEGVLPEKVNGLNEYNLEIADACISRCAEGFEWLVRDARFDMRQGIIWLGGDLFSGYIHEELMEANFLSPTEAVVWLHERIERLLRHILATTHLETLLVVCNDGNHGRLTKRMRIGTRTENSLEWLLYKMLAKRMQDEPRIQFQIADGEYSYVEVFGANLGFFHGDSVQYMGGVGGLLIPMQRGLNELRKYRKLDHVSFGHFHERLDLPELSGNGSMIGITPYGMSKKCKPQRRQQSFFIWDSVQGKCQSTPVWLVDHA